MATTSIDVLQLQPWLLECRTLILEHCLATRSQAHSNEERTKTERKKENCFSILSDLWFSITFNTNDLLQCKK